MAASNPRAPNIKLISNGNCVSCARAYRGAHTIAVRLALQTPKLSSCILIPTSKIYCLVFLSPTIFHHLFLGMTLLKSIKHIRITRVVGITSIMTIIQRDHALYTLAICLVNFSNFVLVLIGPDEWPYKLVSLSENAGPLRKPDCCAPACAPSDRDVIHDCGSSPLPETRTLACCVN